MYPKIHRRTGLVLALALLLAALPAEGALVYQTPSEFMTVGDFDGNGLQDVAVVDRASGAYRLAYQAPAGVLTWAAARAAGLDDVTGVTVGRLLSTARDALAFTAPALNRVHIMDDAEPGSSGSPLPVNPAGVAPTDVLALDIGGAGNTALDDLIVASEYDAAYCPLDEYRNTGGVFSYLLRAWEHGLVHDMQSVLVRAGEAEAAVLTSRLSGQTYVRAYCVTNGNPELILENALDFEDGLILFGHFGASALPKGVAYEPGQAALVLFNWIESGGPLPFTLVQMQIVPMGSPVAGVFLIPERSHVCVLYENGQANIYQLNDIFTFTLVQAVPSPGAGLYITGVVPLPGQDMMLLSGSEAGGPSTHHSILRWNGYSYQALGGGSLPVLSGAAGRANVFLFHEEPFVSSDPQSLAVLRADDWSIAVTLSPWPEQVYATVEQDAGPPDGLGNPIVKNLGYAPAGAEYSLVNQYHPSISLWSQEPAAGIVEATVQASPPGGLNNQPVTVHLSADPSHFNVYYRYGSRETWRLFLQDLVLFEETDLQCFAHEVASGARSPIRTFAYRFMETPGAMDSDGDGVPDYVEIARGLDPIASGPDGDGDGLSDLDELLLDTDPAKVDTDGDTFSDYDEIRYGTDPKNAASKPPPGATIPAGTERYGQRLAFDLIATPRPYDAFGGVTSLAETGAWVYAHTLTGPWLVQSPALMLGGTGVTNPAARLSFTGEDLSPGFVAVATENCFPISTAYPDKNLGREIVRLVPRPDHRPPDVPCVYGGGSLAVEASNWVASASNAYAGLQTPRVTTSLGIIDTLVTLLMERKIGDILFSRGEMADPRISLLSFRVNDADAIVPTVSQLRNIEKATNDGRPAYRLSAMHDALHAYVYGASDTDKLNLRRVVQRVYRASSLSNMPPPAATTLLPVDAIRAFLINSNLPSFYSNSATMSPSAMESALRAVSNALAAVPERPMVTLLLEIRDDSFSGGCTVLYDVDFGEAYSLFTAEERPFQFPGVLEITPHSVVQVRVYLDSTATPCKGAAVEVDRILLMWVPEPTAGDADGNLLPDDFERLVWGGTGQDPFADDDGDGYPNLQEMLEGTDPRRSSSFPGVPPAGLAIPEVSSQTLAQGTFSFVCPWPTEYQSAFVFALDASGDLRGGFSPSGIPPSYENDAVTFSVLASTPGDRRFYRIRMSLK
ncbi:MAG: hypothetical protein KA248_06845 [Kiritimatiellae bacterium]|nr:hypothetical protein [Kiritimatiellia bacterium]